MKLKLLGRRSDAAVPNLVVARRVIARMIAAAQSHLEDETGEALIGLIIPDEESGGAATIYVLDTIAPDDSALRLYHTFQQGDELQDELIWWLQENWRTHRPSLMGDRKKFDAPLRYLGDWHKQPGFMIQPSEGDLFTALDWIDDESNGMNFLIAPIVTLGHPSSAAAGGNYLTAPLNEGAALRVDFWYIDAQSQVFLPIAPVESPNDQLPSLAPYPWHLLDEKRFASEVRKIEEAGYFVSLTLWDTDGTLPLEVCLLTARLGSDNLLILVTPYDYPAHPPTVRIAPFIHMGEDDDLYDVFAEAWEQSVPPKEAALFNPEEGLISLIRAVDPQPDPPDPPSEPSAQDAPSTNAAPQKAAPSAASDAGTASSDAASQKEEAS
ncbi:MAG: hypothetical protein JNL42_23425 [Anaerolineae bacterium]|nr:hypothetical protein [Anaerolineae bacterium]